MGSVLVSFLPYAIAAACAAPIVAVVTAFILAQSDRPIAGSWIFTAGAAFVVTIVSVVILVAFWGTNTADDSSDTSAYIDIGLGTIFLALGILAIFGHETADKDTARRARMKGLASGNLPRLFVVGIMAQFINIDALSMFAAGLKEIIQGDISPGQAAVVVAIGMAVMLIPYYGPALYYQLRPEHAKKMLTPMTEWLLSHSKPIEVIVGIGFGVVFLVKGIGALN